MNAGPTAKKSSSEFNWFEDIAEFGFSDSEEGVERTKSLANEVNKKVVPVSLALFASSVAAIFLLRILPGSIQRIGPYSLSHVFFLVAALSLMLAAIKLLMHCAMVVIRDNFADSQLIHNKTLRMYVEATLWLFSMVPLGIEADPYIPWARKALGLVFTCGIIAVGAFFLKSVALDIFRTRFLVGTLKKKAKNMDLKYQIISAMQSYCYEEVEENTQAPTGACFLGACFDQTDEDEEGGAWGTNSGLESLLGNMFFASNLNRKQLTEHELLALARDTFNKCSRDGEEITFNEFCEIFPNSQLAVQAFIYFDVDKNKRIRKKEMRDAAGSFHMEQRNFNTTYDSLSNFVGVLDHMSSAVVVVLLFLAYLPILGFSLKQVLAFSFSGALLLNFFVTTVAKEFYWNTSFVLTHPFDIGDEVVIDGKDYTIFGVGLYKTELLGPEGGKLTLLNKALWQKTIINMSRAPKKLIYISFELSQGVSPGHFREIKQKVLKYLRAHSDVFYETFTIQSESEMTCNINSLKCVLAVRCKTVGDRMSKLDLKIKLVNCMAEILEGIKRKQGKEEAPKSTHKEK